MSKAMDKLISDRPAQVAKLCGNDTKVCLVSSKPVFNALQDDKVIIMACNTRIKHVIPGIMRAAQDLDAIVCFELAKSEGNLKGGYTGMDPYKYFETVVGYAHERGITVPFFIHGDHVTTKTGRAGRGLYVHSDRRLVQPRAREHNSLDRPGQGRHGSGRRAGGRGR